MAFLPEQALERLRMAAEEQRLAHAYLLGAPEEEMAFSVVRTFAADLLGAVEERLAAHPNFLVISPESKSRRIVIDQIRQLEDALHKTAFLAGHPKIAVVREADRLMDAAANAFLKTLEEPMSGTHIFLLTELPDGVLPTIASRCLPVWLRASGPRRSSKRESAARAIAAELLARNEPALAEIFLGARKFQQLLQESREEAAEEGEKRLKNEKAHYKERTGVDARWFEQEEEKIAARSEAAALRERARLLDALAREIYEQLSDVALGRRGAGSAGVGLPVTARLLRRMAAVERLRADLERNMNESLVIEAGFLEIFGTPEP